MSIRQATDSQNQPIDDCWIIDWYVKNADGKQKRERRRLYGTREEAEEFHLAVRRINQHEINQVINPRIVTLADEWIEDYENDHSKTTVRDARFCLRPLLEFFGNLQIPQITPKLIEAYKKRRRETEILPKNTDPDKLYPDREQRFVKPRTINKELSYFSSMINWAADNSYCNPLPFKIKKFPAKMTKPPTPRIPLPEEIQAMIEAIEPEYRTIFLLYYDAGCRREEALHLEKEDVRLNQHVIHIIGKGNKERIIEITTDRLYNALKDACKKVNSGWLFINPKTGKPYYSIRKALIRAAKEAGIEDRVYTHLLRHTHGTHAMLAGMDSRAIQGQLGHSDIKTTEMYTHLVPELRRRQANKFNRFVGRVTKPVTQKTCNKPESKKKSDRKYN